MCCVDFPLFGGGANNVSCQAVCLGTELCDPNADMCPPFQACKRSAVDGLGDYYHCQ